MKFRWRKGPAHYIGMFNVTVDLLTSLKKPAVSSFLSRFVPIHLSVPIRHNITFRLGLPNHFHGYLKPVSKTGLPQVLAVLSISWNVCFSFSMW